MTMRCGTAIAFTYLPDHRAKLVLFEGGDLLLIESPEGHRALWLWRIREASLAGLGRWLGPFDPHLDLLILEGSAKPGPSGALRSRYPVRQILGEEAPLPNGLRIEMGSLILENREDGWLLRIGSQRVLIARRRPNGEVPRVDLVVYRGDERAGLAIAQGWQAWGLLVGGSPAGGAAGAVSGPRQLRHAGGREWVAAWTDGRVWWFGSGR
ncbi:hypothetical protein [Thermoflexus sp.]|jgi:hypothetical protein|uniref:hypothetical protein n=1 Tax=Thermoflexus sp. TaxID=1969742 RepID=UPI003C116EED